MRRVFISYRRGPSTPYARQIYDELSERLGADRVFYDIDTLEPGTDFLEVIERHIDESGLMLAVMDSTWPTVAHPNGDLRLNDEEDPVRMEVSRALQRKLKVLPVLVGGAKMPKDSALPTPLKPLVRRQAHELSDTRWRADVDDLVTRVAKALDVKNVQPARHRRTSPGKSRRGLIAGGAAAAVAAAVLAFALLGGSGGDGGGSGDATNEALSLSTEMVSLSRQVGTDTNELTAVVDASGDTSSMASTFDESGASAKDLAGRVDDLDGSAPGRDSLATSAQGLTDATEQLATVATDPAGSAAAGAAVAAKEGMDKALGGVEQALEDLRSAFADEGDTDAEAAVSASAQQLSGNSSQLAAPFDALITAVGGG